MKRIAAFVNGHTRFAWVLGVVVALFAGWLAATAVRIDREDARFDLLALKAERLGIQVMGETMNGGLMGSLAAIGVAVEDVKADVRGEIPLNDARVLAVLQSICKLHEAQGAYIVGPNAVIRTSWGTGPALTGVDVSFRPYVRAALVGNDIVYAAIGTTTGERTLYFATPLRDSANSDAVIGVVVARARLERLDRLLVGHPGIALLVSPQGIVFAASRQAWIGYITRPLTGELLAAIREVKQFGAMFDVKEPERLPADIHPGITVFERKRYAVAQAPVQWSDPGGEWTLVLLEDVSEAGQGLMTVALPVGGTLLLLVLVTIVSLRSYHARAEANARSERYASALQLNAEHKEKVAALSLRLQQSRNVEELAASFLTDAHALLGALQGVIYVCPARGGDMELAASYGCENTPPATLAPGDGLLGQRAVERGVAIVEIPPASFWTIHSGLGAARPTVLLLGALELQGRLLGVLELALLQSPPAETLERFREMSAVLSMNLEIQRVNARAQTAPPVETEMLT